MTIEDTVIIVNFIPSLINEIIKKGADTITNQTPKLISVT